VALLAAAGVWFSRFYVSKLRLRASLDLEKREKEQVQQLTQSKMRFFTHVSHELRTPVTLIQSQCEALMQKADIAPSVYNRITGIQGNLHKITRLINELLDFKKQEQDFRRMRFAPANLVVLLERVCLTFREYAAQRDIRFGFEHPEEGLQVWCDAEQIEKVFYNLISNSFKFTESRGEITVSLERSGEEAVVKVRDTGSGIDARHQEHIFDPFYQAPGKSETSLGSGLGLSIARGIVLAHYGQISVESEPGRGTIFTMAVPLGREHIPAELLHEERDEDEECARDIESIDERFIEQVAESRDNAGVGMPTIMIVEDNAQLLKHLSALFAPLYRVIEASDGLDAISKLSGNQPDIILSDLMMPGMDGYELCRRVKNNFATSHIPLVILTAKVAEESALEGFRHGADDYIAKPFNSRILVTRCNNLVNTRVQLQNKFARSTSVKPALLAASRIDRQFIERAAEVVVRNITNPDFDIVLFAREMALGRTKLFTKIKGVTGCTPNRFITNVRLKHSVALLEERPDLSVSEISFMAGFNTPSYFIQSFRALYGVTPAAWRQQAGE
jgi:CheY-like chemotaxis protein/nitrogen-specific signal transduction histidine kinase